MHILSIESSCDETAVAILDATGSESSASFCILAHALASQTKDHEEYGGVYPSMAKRKHGQNITPLLRSALMEAELLRSNYTPLSSKKKEVIYEILKREQYATEALLELLDEIETPEIDAIAVTKGPGLEPALWVGITVAEALALAWDKPLIPVNHMEGHIISAVAEEKADGSFEINDAPFPLLALLLSGAHTEFVRMESWYSKEKIGGTRDDAIGEAYDKVGRMLSLTYPGGPKVSRLRDEAVLEGLLPLSPPFPRPMILNDDLDFSFSGLKTAVLYRIRDIEKEEGAPISEEMKKRIAREFTDAVRDVVVKKTTRALQETNARGLVVSGGVSANTHLREALATLLKDEFPECTLFLPKPELATDNAVMIAMAAYFDHLREGDTKSHQRALIERKDLSPSTRVEAEGRMKYKK